MRYYEDNFLSMTQISGKRAIYEQTLAYTMILGIAIINFPYVSLRQQPASINFQIARPGVSSCSSLLIEDEMNVRVILTHMLDLFESK